MADIFRTLIVTNADAPLAREIAASFGPGGAGMWTTPLSANGQYPATHWISSGYIPAEFAYLCPEQVWALDESGNWVMVSYTTGDPVVVYTEASASGVQCTQADVDAIFADSDVTAQEPFVAMGRMGLLIIDEGVVS